MEEVQARFQITRFSPVTCMIFLLRSLPRSIIRDAAEEYDTLVG